MTVIKTTVLQAYPDLPGWSEDTAGIKDNNKIVKGNESSSCDIKMEGEQNDSEQTKDTSCVTTATDLIHNCINEQTISQIQERVRKVSLVDPCSSSSCTEQKENEMNDITMNDSILTSNVKDQMNILDKSDTLPVPSIPALPSTTSSSPTSQPIVTDVNTMTNLSILNPALQDLFRTTPGMGSSYGGDDSITPSAPISSANSSSSDNLNLTSTTYSISSSSSSAIKTITSTPITTTSSSNLKVTTSANTNTTATATIISTTTTTPNTTDTASSSNNTITTTAPSVWKPFRPASHGRSASAPTKSGRPLSWAPSASQAPFVLHSILVNGNSSSSNTQLAQSQKQFQNKGNDDSLNYNNDGDEIIVSNLNGNSHPLRLRKAASTSSSFYGSALADPIIQQMLSSASSSRSSVATGNPEVDNEHAERMYNMLRHSKKYKKLQVAKANAASNSTTDWDAALDALDASSQNSNSVQSTSPAASGSHNNSGVIIPDPLNSGNTTIPLNSTSTSVNPLLDISKIENSFSSNSQSVLMNLDSTPTPSNPMMTNSISHNNNSSNTNALYQISMSRRRSKSLPPPPSGLNGVSKPLTETLIELEEGSKMDVLKNVNLNESDMPSLTQSQPPHQSQSSHQPQLSSPNEISLIISISSTSNPVEHNVTIVESTVTSMNNNNSFGGGIVNQDTNNINVNTGNINNMDDINNNNSNNGIGNSRRNDRKRKTVSFMLEPVYIEREPTPPPTVSPNSFYAKYLKIRDSLLGRSF